MTEYDAFTEAVAASPDDDMPRLAFADWLLERDGDGPCPHCGGCGFWAWDGVGRPDGDGVLAACRGEGTRPNEYAARYEFITAQVEAARLRREGYPCYHDLTRPPGCEVCRRLVAAEEVLDRGGRFGLWSAEVLRVFALHGPARLVPASARVFVGCASGRLLWDFGRGFVSSLSAPLDMLWDRGHPGLRLRSLLRREPVAEVLVADRSPYPRPDGGYSWWMGPAGESHSWFADQTDRNLLIAFQNILPASLWALLGGNRVAPDVPAREKCYPTRGAATDAVSRAVIGAARPAALPKEPT